MNKQTGDPLNKQSDVQYEVQIKDFKHYLTQPVVLCTYYFRCEMFSDTPNLSLIVLRILAYKLNSFNTILRHEVYQSSKDVNFKMLLCSQNVITK